MFQTDSPTVQILMHVMSNVYNEISDFRSPNHGVHASTKRTVPGQVPVGAVQQRIPPAVRHHQRGPGDEGEVQAPVAGQPAATG
jgi:hypothetical protein